MNDQTNTTHNADEQRAAAILAALAGKAGPFVFLVTEPSGDLLPIVGWPCGRASHRVLVASRVLDFGNEHRYAICSCCVSAVRAVVPDAHHARDALKLAWPKPGAAR